MKLRAAITVVFFVGFFIPTVVACFLTVHYQRQVLTAELKEDHTRTVEVLAQGLREAVWALAPEAGIPIVDAVMTDTRIQKIQVDSEEGLFIRKTREKPIQNQYIQTLKKPILYQGRRIGDVSMDIDISSMEAVLSRQQARYLWISLGPFFLSAVILFWVLSRKILRPINRLLLQSEELAAKKLDREFEWEQKDEIGILGQSFEKTRQSLAALFRELEQTNERVVGQAGELTRTNEKLKSEVAERKRVAAELIRHQEKLEEIISQRTAELITSNRELKQEIKDRRRIEKERRGMEIRLQRVEKMEALGNLAGGVAHDLNNILSGIVSYPELMLLDISEDDPMHKPLKMIQNAGERAAVVVQDLLTLARRGIAINDVMDLEKVVLAYLDSPEHRNLMESHPVVNVETDFNTRGFKIRGSSVHITKTVMNLVSNAAEAIHEAGVVQISIHHGHNDGSLPVPAGGSDDFLILSISDNGTGIRQEDLEHVFEPFYTTKVMGKSGSGLGMAVVWGTVQDHNGIIDIQSEVGQGTRVNIYLPASRYESFPDASELPETNRPGRQKILVVDDIEDQRIITVSMLKRLGYHAEAAGSGEAAIEILSRRRFDLLILDMLMEPGMNGLETFRKSLAFNPDQHAVIASGFSEQSHIREVNKLKNCRYLKKPFLLNDLRRAVQGALAESERSGTE